VISRILYIRTSSFFISASWTDFQFTLGVLGKSECFDRALFASCSASSDEESEEDDSSPSEEVDEDSSLEFSELQMDKISGCLVWRETVTSSLSLKIWTMLLGNTT